MLSIVDDFSFRLDKYVGLHNDIFMTPDHGAHHGANPGASMIAVVSYLPFKPVVDRIVTYTTTGRRPAEDKIVYTEDRQVRAQFYRKVRELGLDIKFALVGFITMVFCMAPLSALSAVVMFNALHYSGLSSRLSLAMSLLYALGTPVFFRTAYLNQNLMVGIFAFSAFVLLWQQEFPGRLKVRQRYFVAGFLGGLALLCDYSGMIVLMMVGGYGLLKRINIVSFSSAIKDSLWYAAGAVGPVGMLWFYQWSSFGHPFYPPQHFMPHQIYSEAGYQGVSGPSGELLWMLLFSGQFGLFITAPILLLAFFAPLLSLFKKNIVPPLETAFIFVFSIAFTLFFSSVQYTRLQWITGIRYIVPVIPFIFLLTVAVMVHMPRIIAFIIAILALIESWSMSMVRRVDVPDEGVASSVLRFFMEGFQLPWLNTLSKASAQYAPFLEGRMISPLPFFLLLAVLIYGIWRLRLPWGIVEKVNIPGNVEEYTLEKKVYKQNVEERKSDYSVRN